MREGEYGVGDKLQLRLELSGVGAETLPPRAGHEERIVWRGRAARVPTPEVVLPELCRKPA